MACASATCAAGDVAQADVTDQTLALEVGQHIHLLSDGALLGAMDACPSRDS